MRFRRAIIVIIASAVCLFDCASSGSVLNSTADDALTSVKRRGLDALTVDIDSNGYDDVVVKWEMPRELSLLVVFGPSLEDVSSVRFPIGSALLENSFCDNNIEMTAEYVSSNNVQARTSRPVIRLSDGKCDAFFLEWDQTKARVIWSRTPYGE